MKLPKIKAPLSSFDLSESNLRTMKMDEVTPVYWEELSPGDNFNIKISSLAIMQPMVAPCFSDIRMKYAAFWIPNTLIWRNFPEFMGEKQWSEQDSFKVVPQMEFGAQKVQPGELGDCLGLPINVSLEGNTVSSLPFRAYWKLWNDYFRPMDITQPISYATGDETSQYSDEANRKLLKAGKKADYFTSCLPSPSVPNVEIGLTGNAPVAVDNKNTTTKSPYVTVRTDFDGEQHNLYQKSSALFVDSNTGPSNDDASFYADMTKVTGLSTESLRRLTAMQVLLEKDYRYGQRYNEIVESHWGVELPPWLSGMSLLLGTATSSINVNPVAQTSSSSDISPQGNLAANGVGVEDEDLCNITAYEHGILMIVAWCNSDQTYFQGIPKKFSKKGRFDYYFPEFQNLGDEVVYNREIYVSGNEEDNKPFGYQERYRYLREGYDKVGGLLSLTADKNLGMWHLGEKFATLPKLNATFMESATPVERIMAVTDEPPILLAVNFDILANRPLKVDSHPSILSGALR